MDKPTCKTCPHAREYPDVRFVANENIRGTPFQDGTALRLKLFCTTDCVPHGWVGSDFSCDAHPAFKTEKETK